MNNKLFNGCDGTMVNNANDRYKTLIEDVFYIIEYQNLAAKKKNIDIQTCKQLYGDKFENAMIAKNLRDIQAIHLDGFSFYYIATNDDEFTILHIHDDGSMYYVFDDTNNILVKIMYNYDYYIDSYQWFYCDNLKSENLEELINQDFENIFCSDAYSDKYDDYAYTIKNKIIDIL